MRALGTAPSRCDPIGPVEIPCEETLRETLFEAAVVEHTGGAERRKQRTSVLEERRAESDDLLLREPQALRRRGGQPALASLDLLEPLGRGEVRSMRMTVRMET